MENKSLEVLIIGARNRGMYAYGELAKREDMDMSVVAVAEPVKDRREKMKLEHHIPEERCYETGKEALEQEKFCDAVIITTPDMTHKDLALMALDKGYDVLLEKPMATNAMDCVEIVEAQKRSGSVLCVAHVLRYTPFFNGIKDIIDSKELGAVKEISIVEEVGHLHYPHSYVRGNWRRKDESGPIILTKSCHDMDIIPWLIGDSVKSVRSEGSLKTFKESNAPEGSTLRCTDDCKAKSTCKYNAEEYYLHEKDPNKLDLFVKIISPVDKSVEARRKAIETGPYGRCVYRCDNDVNDHERVTINFNKDINAEYTMKCGGEEFTRKVTVEMEKGQIHGDLSKGSLFVLEYPTYTGGETKRTIDLPNESRDGHGGGDELILKSFIKVSNSNNEKYNLTSAQTSLQSHLMCFAAEESSVKGMPINFQIYKRKLGLKS